MRSRLVDAALVLAFSGVAQAADEPGGQDYAQLAHGRYMVAAADCMACHTDPRTNAVFAGGRPIQTPFGRVLSSNITPDKSTGIGAWTDAEFERALRQGQRRDGSRLYPAMPYPYYTRMTHEDVLAIRAFLSTVPAVVNKVQSDQLPFPFSIRAGMRLWNALYFTPGTFHPDPGQPAEWNRGAYLVQGPGHCGACHTPKSFLGGDENDRALQGYSLQGWFAPNITDNPALGLGRWSSEDVVAFLRSGHNRIAAASGPMSAVVLDGSSQLNDADLRAEALYLKGQRQAAAAQQPLAASDPSMKAGAAIYQDLCSACHQQDGTGVAFLIPNLALSSAVASREPTSLLRVLCCAVPRAWRRRASPQVLRCPPSVGTSMMRRSPPSPPSCATAGGMPRSR